MDEDRLQRIHRVLSCSEALVHSFNPGRDVRWFHLDLTMPQLKTLIFVCKHEDATSGQIASGLGVTLSTMTGIVDRLAEQNLVVRREDPRDRRVTRVLPTDEGQRLVQELIQYRNEVVTSVLGQLDPEQLKVVETAFQYLLDAVARVEAQRSETEAVA